MSRSMLAAVHLAVNPDETATPEMEDETEEDIGMSKETTGSTGTVSAVDHAAAVAAAQDKGYKAGVGEANSRMGAILGAEGIRGDGGRMAAAFDLAMKSPEMKAEDVSAFVTANVAAAAAVETDASAYERDRVAGAGLAAPVGKEGGGRGAVKSWSDFRAKRERTD